MRDGRGAGTASTRTLRTCNFNLPRGHNAATRCARLPAGNGAGDKASSQGPPAAARPPPTPSPARSRGSLLGLFTFQAAVWCCVKRERAAAGGNKQQARQARRQCARLSPRLTICPAARTRHCAAGHTAAEPAAALPCQSITKPGAALFACLAPPHQPFTPRHRPLTPTTMPPQKQEFKEYTRDEVAAHNTPGDTWIVIDATVYNVSTFAELHPGGESVFYSQDIAGDDATETFFGLHRREILDKPMAKRLIVGKIKDEEPEVKPKALGAPSPVPFAEPTWLHPTFKTPYYNESHYRLQREVRAYVEANIIQVARECEANGKRPPIELVKDMGARGLNAMRMGPGKVLKGRKLFADIKPEEFDYFHEMIITHELARSGVRGWMDGLQGGMVIGLPPIVNFGNPDLQKEIIEPVLAGEKFIALAVTEAFAGSDVMGIRTTARKQKDGSYVVNGTKKVCCTTISQAFD